MSGSPTLATHFAHRVVIGVGDMAVSNSLSTILSTYALGSCIGVIAYDPHGKCGGILHLMLPEAKVSPQKALTQPAMFADTGLPLFFKALLGLRAERTHLRLFVTGGAHIIAGHDPFKIGERNIHSTLAFVTENHLNLIGSETGGSVSRTVHLDLSNGTVSLLTAHGKSQVALGCS